MSVVSAEFSLRIDNAGDWRRLKPRPDIVALLGDVSPYVVEDLSHLPGSGAALMTVFATENTDPGQPGWVNPLTETDWFGDLGKALLGFAEWLAPMDAARFDQMRVDGYKIDAYFFYYLDDPMLDIELPPELMGELGRLKIPVKVYTEAI